MVPWLSVTISGLYFQKMDAKLAMADASYQWIDIDPFGSPVPFIDSAIQSLARTGVLEVTATDTAALTGSSLSSQNDDMAPKELLMIMPMMMQ